MLETYYKERLTASERAAYEDICTGIRARQREFPVRYTDGLGRVLRAVNYDHPEFFYVNWLDHVRYVTSHRGIRMSVSYLYDADEIEGMNGRIRALSRSIAGISERGRVSGVHDWFVTNVRYDHEGLGKIIRSPAMFSAAGPLTSQMAVCEGISKLACYLLRLKGVDAALAVGSSRDGTPHAWNMTRVGGGCLHSDITFDIGLSAGRGIQRRYLLISREEMSRDHTINEL